MVIVKKIILFALSFVLLFSLFPIQAFANYIGIDNYNDDVIEVVSYDLEGNRVSSSREFIAPLPHSASDTNYGYDIKNISENLYANLIETTFGIDFIYVGKFSLDVMNGREFGQAMSNDYLTDSMKEAIQELRSLAIHDNRDRKIVTLFSELLVPEIASSRTRTYTTFNGTRMRRDLLTFNRDTGYHFIVSGTGTRNFIQNAFGLAATGFSQVSPRVNFVVTGVTIFQHVVNALGTNSISTSANDWFQIRVRTNARRHRLYSNVGNAWLLGLTTNQDTKTNINTLTRINGQTTPSARSPHTVLTTINHNNNDWSVAHNNTRSPINQFNQTLIHNVRFDLR